ncbi:hypothetical protein RKE25_16485 [Dyella sp. BiH032]|uniref:hypothetical protein n=1 Tax=Dyella sp. BiH032 TaxID=3075430 RepID=UPI002892FCDA|nr:hypothetical protein [Dyella sp. BiH032]WNL45006.1 hypothetical protein RKE25_16485 [Dyella sp. BiH032]
MADQDHKAPAYLSTPSTEQTPAPHPAPSHPTNPLGRPFYLTDDIEDAEQRLLTRLAGIQLALNVLNDLLANSEAFRDQQACGQHAPPGEWPLPPTCVEGLFMAVHFLSEYGHSLSLRAMADTEQATAS